MERFIPYEKLSKKKKRELDLKRRGSWGGLNPVTRKPANPKAYDRRKAQSWKKDPGSALFQFKPALPGFKRRMIAARALRFPTAFPSGGASGNTGRAAALRRADCAG